MDDLSTQYVQMANGPQSQLHDSISVVNFVEQMQLAIERSTAPRKNFLLDSTTPRGDVIITEVSAMKPGNGWVTLQVTEGIRRGVHEWGVTIEHQGETTDGSGLMLGIVPKSFTKHDSFISQGGGWCLSRAGKFYGHWRRQEANASVAFGTGDRVIFILDYEAARMTVRVGDKYVVGEISNIAPEVFPAVSLHYRHQFVRFEYRKVHDRHSKKLNWIQRLAFPHAAVFLPLERHQLGDVPLDSYVFSPQFVDSKGFMACRSNQQLTSGSAEREADIEDEETTTDFDCDYESPSATHARLVVVLRAVHAVRRYCTDGVASALVFLDRSISAELLRAQRHALASQRTGRRSGKDAAIDCGALVLIHLFAHSSMSASETTMLPVVHSLQDYLRGIELFSLSESSTGYGSVGTIISPDVLQKASDTVFTLIERSGRGDGTGSTNANGGMENQSAATGNAASMLTELLLLMALQSGAVCELLRVARILLRSPAYYVSPETLSWLSSNKAALTPRLCLPKLHEGYDAVEENMEHLTPFCPSIDTKIISVSYDHGDVFIHTIDSLTRWGIIGGVYKVKYTTAEPHNCCPKCKSSSIAFSKVEGVIFHTDLMVSANLAVVIYSVTLEIRRMVALTTVPQWPTTSNFVYICSGPGDQLLLVYDVAHKTEMAPSPAAAATLSAATAGGHDVKEASRNGIELQVFDSNKFPELRWRTPLYPASFDRTTRSCVTLLKGSVVDFGDPESYLRSAGGQMTVEIWIKILDKDDVSVFYQHGDRSTSGEVFLETARLEGAWRIRGGYRHDYRGMSVVSSPFNPACESRFVHVALVFDGSWRLHLDGEEVSRTKQCLQVSLEKPSQRWSAGNDCVCQLAGLRVWKGSRSLREIVRDSSRVLRGDEPGLLCQYLFNEHNGNVVYNHVQAEAGMSRHAIIRGPFSRAHCNDHPLLASSRGTVPLGATAGCLTKATSDLPNLGHTRILFNGAHLVFMERDRVLLGFPEARNTYQAVFFDIETGCGINCGFVLRHRNKLGYLGCDEKGRFWELFQVRNQMSAPVWNQQPQSQTMMSAGTLPLSCPVSLGDDDLTWCHNLVSSSGRVADGSAGVDGKAVDARGTSSAGPFHSAEVGTSPVTFGALAVWLLNLLSAFTESSDPAATNALFSPLLDDVSVRCVQEVRQLLCEHCRPVKSISARRSLCLKDGTSTKAMDTAMRVLLRIVRRVRDFKIHPDTIGLSEASVVEDIPDTLRRLSALSQRRHSTDLLGTDGTHLKTYDKARPKSKTALSASAREGSAFPIVTSMPQVGGSLLGILTDIINEAGLSLPAELGSRACIIVVEGITLFFPSAAVRARLLRELLSKERECITRCLALHILLHAVVKSFTDVTSAATLLPPVVSTGNETLREETLHLDGVESGASTTEYGRLLAVKTTLSTLVVESTRQVMCQTPNESREQHFSLLSTMAEAIGVLQMLLFSHSDVGCQPDIMEKMDEDLDSRHMVHGSLGLGTAVKDYYTELFDNAGMIFEIFTQRLQTQTCGNSADLTARVSIIFDVLRGSFIGIPLHTAITALPLMCTLDETDWLLGRLNQLLSRYRTLSILLRRNMSPEVVGGGHWPLHILDNAILLASSWVASFMSLGQISLPPAIEKEGSSDQVLPSTLTGAGSAEVDSKGISAAVREVCDNPLLAAGPMADGGATDEEVKKLMALRVQPVVLKTVAQQGGALVAKTPVEVEEVMLLAALTVVHLSSSTVGDLGVEDSAQLLSRTLVQLKGVRSGLLSQRSKKPSEFPRILDDAKERCYFLLRMKKVTNSKTTSISSLFLAREYVNGKQRHLKRMGEVSFNKWKRAFLIFRMKRLYHMALVHGWSSAQIPTAAKLVERVILSHEITLSGLQKAIELRERRCLQRLSGLQHIYELFKSDPRLACRVVSALFNGSVGNRQSFESGISASSDETRCKFRQAMYNIIRRLCEVTKPLPGQRGTKETCAANSTSEPLSVPTGGTSTLCHAATLSEVLNRKWAPGDFCFFREVRVVEVVFLSFCSIFQRGMSDSLRHEGVKERSHRCTIRGPPTVSRPDSVSNTGGASVGGPPRATNDSSNTPLVTPPLGGTGGETDEQALRHTPSERATLESLNALRSLGLQCAAALDDASVAPNEIRGCVNFLDLMFEVFDDELRKCANYTAQLYFPDQDRVMEQVGLLCTLISILARALPNTFVCTEVACPKAALLAFRLCVIADVLVLAAPVNAAASSLAEVCIQTSVLLLCHCSPVVANPLFARESVMDVVRRAIPSATVECAVIGFLFSFVLRCVTGEGCGGGSSAGGDTTNRLYETGMRSVSALHTLICSHPWDLTFPSLHGAFLADLTDSISSGETARCSGVRLLVWIFAMGGPPSLALVPGGKALMGTDERLGVTEAVYIVECNQKSSMATVLPAGSATITEEREVSFDNLLSVSQEEVVLPRYEVLFQFLTPALERCFSSRFRPHPSPFTWTIVASLLRITLGVLSQNPAASYVLLGRGILAQVDDFAFRTPARTPLPLRYLYEMWPMLLQKVLSSQQRVLFDAVIPSSRTNDSQTSSYNCATAVARATGHDHHSLSTGSAASHSANLLFNVATAARYSAVPCLDEECNPSGIGDNGGNIRVTGVGGSSDSGSKNCSGSLPVFFRLQQAHSSLCLTPSVLCFSGAKSGRPGTLVIKGVNKDGCIPAWSDGLTIEASVLLHDRLSPELGEVFVIPSSWSRPSISFSLFSLYERRGESRNSILRVVLEDDRMDCVVETSTMSAVVVSTKFLQDDWDRWIHLSVVLDSKSVTLYKDGIGTAASLPRHLGVYLEDLFTKGRAERLVIGNVNMGTIGEGVAPVQIDDSSSDDDSNLGDTPGNNFMLSDGVTVAIDSLRVWGCVRSLKAQRSAADFVAREQTLPVYNTADGHSISFRFTEATGNETYSERSDGVGLLNGFVRWAPFPVLSGSMNLEKVDRGELLTQAGSPLFIPRREFENFFSMLDHTPLLRLAGDYIQTICAHLSRQCVIAAIQQAMSREYRVVQIERCYVSSGNARGFSTPIDPRNIIASSELVSHIINLLRYSDTGTIDGKVVVAVSQFIKECFNAMVSEKRLVKGFREAAVAITKALHDESEPFYVELPPVSYAGTDVNLLPIATINGPGGVVSFDANSRGIEQMTLLRDRKQRVLLAKYPDAQSGWPELEIPSDSLWFYAKPNIGSRSASPSFTVSARSLKPQAACAIFAALRDVLSSESRFHCGLSSFLNTPFLSLLTVRVGTTKCAAVSACRIYTAVLELWRKFPQFAQHDQCPLKIILAHFNASLMSVLHRSHTSLGGSSVLSSCFGRHNVKVQCVFELLVAAMRTEAAWNIVAHNHRTQRRWRRLCALWGQSIGLCAPCVAPGVNAVPLPSSTVALLASNTSSSLVTGSDAKSSEREWRGCGHVHLVLLPLPGTTSQHQPKTSIFQRGSGVWSASCDRGFLSARSNVGFKRGRFYFEIRLPANGDGISVGAVTERAQQTSFLSPRGLGHDGDSWGFESAQMCRFHHGFRHEFTVRAKWKGLDVVGIMLDLEADTLVCLHEERQVSSFEGLKSSLGCGSTVSFFPAVSFGAGGVDVNFGAAPFVYTLPPGFLPVDPSNYVVPPTATLWALISAIEVSEVISTNDGKSGDPNDGGALGVSTAKSSKGFRQLPDFLVEASSLAASYYSGRSGPLRVSLLPCDVKAKMTSLQGSEVRAEEDPRFFRGSVCVRSGCWYYEVGLRGDALVGIGWVTATAATDWSRSRVLGDDADSWVLEGNRATTRHNKHQRGIGGQLWKHGDIIGCAVDCDAGTITYTLNGVPLQEMHDPDGDGVLFHSVDCSNGIMPVISVEPKNSAVVHFSDDELSYLPRGCCSLGTKKPIRKALESHYCGKRGGQGRKNIKRDGYALFSPSLARCLLFSLSSLTELNFTNSSAYCLEDTLAKAGKDLFCDKFQGHSNALQLLVSLQNITYLAETLIPYASTVTMPLECDTLLSGPIHRALSQLHDYMLPVAGLRALHTFLAQTKCSGESLKLTLNRRKALSLMKDTSVSLVERLSGSLFGQVYHLLRDKGASLFCTSKKLWSVNFVGEGADDIGGPYRESITQLCSEVMSPDLPLFIPSPNQTNEIGECREVVVVRPALEAPVRLDMYHFFGRFIGGCLRSSEPVPVYLSSRVWKAILGAPVDARDLGRVDAAALQSYRYIQQHISSAVGDGSGAIDEEIAELCPGGFSVVDDIGVEQELFPGGRAIRVNGRNVHIFLELALHYRLHTMGEAQIRAIADGFHQVVPLSAVSLLKWYELERIVCGLPDYDADELLDTARYEDLDPESTIVQYLRQVLRQFSRHERALFMRFVSGRERLPSGVRLKVMLDAHARQTRDERSSSYVVDGERCTICTDTADDDRLPHASTCFYWLSLPKYSSVEVMREKLLFAIQHCLDIDADFMVRDSGNVENETEPTLAVVVEDDDEFEDFSHLR